MAAGIGRLLLAALTVLVLGYGRAVMAALPNGLNEEEHQHGGLQHAMNTAGLGGLQHTMNTDTVGPVPEHHRRTLNPVGRGYTGHKTCLGAGLGDQQKRRHPL